MKVKALWWPGCLVLLVLVGALAGCGGVSSAPNPQAGTSIAGPSGRQFTPIPPPPAWREPSAPITRENVNQSELLGRLDSGGTTSTLFAYGFSPDGTGVVALNNERILGWDLISSQRVFSEPRQGASFVYYSPDKTEIYALSNDGTITVYNMETRRIVNDFLGHPDFNNASAFYPQEGWLALGGTEGTVKVWDPTQRLSMVTFRASGLQVERLVFSDDGRLLAIAGPQDIVQVWDWQARQQVATLDNSATQVRNMAFKPGAEALAVGRTNDVAIWSIARQEVLFTLPTGQGGTFDVLKYSPDGRFLITGGLIPDTIVWDAATGKLLARLPGVGGDVTSAAFSPDGDLLLAAVLDGPVTLWDMTSITSETVSRADLNVGTNRVLDVAFTPDGFSMLFFDAIGPVYVWGVPPAAP